MTAPDADELAVRDRLHQLLEHPAPSPADTREPAGLPASDDWWEQGYDEDPNTAPDTDNGPPATEAATDPDGWWDELYAGDEPTPVDAADELDANDEPPAPTAPARPHPAASDPPPPQHRPAARQSLLDAWDGTSRRMRWLIYHGTAAAFGWGFGLVSWSMQVTAWIAADRYTAPQSIACYVLAALAVAAYRRSRGWWWPIAWTAATPVSAFVLGVLLYAPNS